MAPVFQPSPGRLPEAQRVYAVGDVHGCDDRLAALHAMIRDDLAARPVGDATLVHLGDYIDRGPDSRGVLRRIAVPPAPGLEVVSLLGNHEALMRQALDGDAEAMRQWRSNGGDATLESFDLTFAVGPAAWREAIGPAVLRQIDGMGLTWEAGTYLFVHAGLRPGIALADQVPADLLWIRRLFLDHAGDFGHVVVHGHTPRAEPDLRANRIGIDTAAVTGGALTCAVLEGDRVAFIAA